MQVQKWKLLNSDFSIPGGELGMIVQQNVSYNGISDIYEPEILNISLTVLLAVVGLIIGSS